MTEDEKVTCEETGPDLEEKAVDSDVKEETVDPSEDTKKETEDAGKDEEAAADSKASEDKASEDQNDQPAKEPEAIDYYDRWLRVTAEYQNYRNRTIKEKEEIYQNANAKFIEGLLEVIDNFERAMQTKPENDKFADGIELIYKQFLAVLDKNHVKEIPAKGEKFDPVVHMAIQMMPVEGMESDMVAEVIKKGYTLNDKVIRPAMVVVSQ